MEDVNPTILTALTMKRLIKAETDKLGRGGEREFHMLPIGYIRFEDTRKLKVKG